MQSGMTPALAVATPSENPHYAKLGGDAAVRRLVERFYDFMDELPEAHAIRAMHPQDLTSSREKLYWFLSGWLGGPPLYTERYGPPRLRQRHLPFPIDISARDAWMLCMNRALEAEVVDPEFRAQLAAAFLHTADFLRNKTEDSL